MVFYSQDLEQTERDVIDAGGQINREILVFPVGDVSILKSQVVMRWRCGGQVEEPTALPMIELFNVWKTRHKSSR